MVKVISSLTFRRPHKNAFYLKVYVNISDSVKRREELINPVRFFCRSGEGNQWQIKEFFSAFEGGFWGKGKFLFFIGANTRRTLTHFSPVSHFCTP